MGWREKTREVFLWTSLGCYLATIPPCPFLSAPPPPYPISELIWVEDHRLHLPNRSLGQCCPGNLCYLRGAPDSVCSPRPPSGAGPEKSSSGGIPCGSGCPSLRRQASPPAWKWKVQPGPSGRPATVGWERQKPLGSPVRVSRGAPRRKLPPLDVTASWRSGLQCPPLEGTSERGMCPGSWAGVARTQATSRRVTGAPPLGPSCSVFSVKRKRELLTADVILPLSGPTLHQPPLPLPVEVICTTELPPASSWHLEMCWLNE